MKPAATAYFASCAAVVVSSLVYVAPGFVALPVAWYYPLAHTWVVAGRATGFALDWYGRTLWCLLAAGATAVAGAAVTRRMRDPSPRAYRVWAVWAGMASLLAIAVYTYQLAQREPVPEELPAQQDAH